MTNHQPIWEGTVRRVTLARLVSLQFAIFLLLLGAGLQLVKYQAAESAAVKAQAVAVTTLAQTHRQDLENRRSDRYQLTLQRYNTNHTACSLRALVDPQIKENRALIKTYLAGAKDKTANPELRAQNKTRAAIAQKSVYGLVKFRAVYTTIPPVYRCKDLPNTLPKPPKPSYVKP